MNIKHYAGYGTVKSIKINDNKKTGATLHVRVIGNHERGLVRTDEYDLYNWLVKKFDKNETDYTAWHKKVREKMLHSHVLTPTNAGYYYREGSIEENGKQTDTCDYWFYY